MVDNYKSIINILKHEVEDNNDKDISRAIGLWAVDNYLIYISMQYGK